MSKTFSLEHTLGVPAVCVRLEGAHGDGLVRDFARHVQPPHPPSREPQENIILIVCAFIELSCRVHLESWT